MGESLTYFCVCVCVFITAETRCLDREGTEELQIATTGTRTGEFTPERADEKFIVGLLHIALTTPSFFSFQIVFLI